MESSYFLNYALNILKLSRKYGEIHNPLAIKIRQKKGSLSRNKNDSKEKHLMGKEFININSMYITMLKALTRYLPCLVYIVI